MKSNKSFSNSSNWNSGLSTESLRSLTKTKAPQDLERKWGEIHTEYRRRYPELLHEDLHYRPGGFNSMTERIAKRTFRNTDDVLQEIIHWRPSLY